MKYLIKGFLKTYASGEEGKNMMKAQHVDLCKLTLTPIRIDIGYLFEPEKFILDKKHL